MCGSHGEAAGGTFMGFWVLPYTGTYFNPKYVNNLDTPPGTLDRYASDEDGLLDEASRKVMTYLPLHL